MQVTVSPRLTKKSKQVTDFAQKLLVRRLSQAIEFLADETTTPVDTGAFARSMTLNQRGDGSGPSISSRRKEGGVDKGATLEDMKTRLYGQLESIDPLQGATFVNRAPHARYVEMRFGIFDRLRNILT